MGCPSRPRGRTCVTCISCTGRRVLYPHTPWNRVTDDRRNFLKILVLSGKLIVTLNSVLVLLFDTFLFNETRISQQLRKRCRLTRRVSRACDGATPPPRAAGPAPPVQPPPAVPTRVTRARTGRLTHSSGVAEETQPRISWDPPTRRPRAESDPPRRQKARVSPTRTRPGRVLEPPITGADKPQAAAEVGRGAEVECGEIRGKARSQLSREQGEKPAGFEEEVSPSRAALRAPPCAAFGSGLLCPLRHSGSWQLMPVRGRA